ncbi:MAG TPA: hypothetical protein VH143_33265 [Kofleriaceae bacterium]|nr:hypothetical protein [Kofleriaceae bacterium]
MNRLVPLFVLSLALACTKPDDLPALREEAHATVAYENDQLDALDTRFQKLSRDGQDIKQVLDGGDEMGRLVVGAFNGFVELNKRMAVEADAIKKSGDDALELAAHTAAYRELAEDGVAAGSDHVRVPSIAAIGSVLTAGENWLARAHTQMAALGSAGGAIIRP